MTLNPNSKLAAVEAYVADGWSPWPCVPGEKIPHNVDGYTWAGKNVATGQRGPHRPLTETQRKRIWNKRGAPDILLIIPAGRFVLDLDTKNNTKLEVLFEPLIAVTRCAYTPTGGLHAFFRCPSGMEPRTFDPALGVDVQGPGVLIGAPPGRGRHWANDLPEAEWMTFDVAERLLS